MPFESDIDTPAFEYVSYASQGLSITLSSDYSDAQNTTFTFGLKSDTFLITLAFSGVFKVNELHGYTVLPKNGK